MNLMKFEGETALIGRAGQARGVIGAVDVLGLPRLACPK